MAKKEKDQVLENLKVEINTLLWSKLPGNTTLDEAEDIACAIVNLIDAQWEKRP